jgi:hypothetical protein
MFIVVFAIPSRWTKKAYEQIYTERGLHIIILKNSANISGALSGISLASFFAGMSILAVLSMRRIFS